MAYMSGDEFCGCRLLQRCGSGSYGEVWLAEDAVGTRVALKILFHHNDYSDRELKGLRNYKDCNHPNLLKIRYVEISGERICYTMDAADDLNHGAGDYLPDTLANRLNRSGRLDGNELTAMLNGLLDGLEELHKKGLVHRDIKPDNILWVNGRATLADAGLIANNGANSLCGTPGFLSPDVLAGKPAEASDDFYALGKVIYCALTGLDVSEYPGLPPEMTISVDAELNRILRVCCSKTVTTSAEIRKILAEKKGKPLPGINLRRLRFPLTAVLFFLLIVVLSCTVCYFIWKPEKIEKTENKIVIPPVKLDPEAQKMMDQMEEAEREAPKELQRMALSVFQRMGFFFDQGKHLPDLLNYKILTSEQINLLIWNCSQNPRLVPITGLPPKTKKSLTPVEIQLFNILVFAGHFKPKNVQQRQDYWRSRSGSPEQILKEMLTTDILMQAVAVDFIIRSKANRILAENKLTAQEKKELGELVKLRDYLLYPSSYQMEYLARLFQQDE